MACRGRRCITCAFCQPQSKPIHRSHAVLNLELPLPCSALPCIARETAVRLPIAASAGIAAGLTATACAVQRLESALLCFATLFSNQSLVLCHRPLSPDYRVIRPHSDRDDVRSASRSPHISPILLSSRLDPDFFTSVDAFATLFIPRPTIRAITQPWHRPT